MEYQKIILDNTPSQPFKFRTKNWLKINDDLRLLMKTSTIKLNLKLRF